jgi:hypothetical protein
MPQAVFDKVASMEGQVIDGMQIHSVDRKAGTLKLGATGFQVMKRIPVIAEQLKVFLDECSPAPVLATGDDNLAPRGAQWKRERNAHRRAW